MSDEKEVTIKDVYELVDTKCEAIFKVIDHERDRINNLYLWMIGLLAGVIVALVKLF